MASERRRPVHRKSWKISRSSPAAARSFESSSPVNGWAPPSGLSPGRPSMRTGFFGHHLRLDREREDAMEDCDVEHQPAPAAGEFLLPNLREAPDFVSLDERAVDRGELGDVVRLREIARRIAECTRTSRTSSERASRARLAVASPRGRRLRGQPRLASPEVRRRRTRRSPRAFGRSEGERVGATRPTALSRVRPRWHA